MKRNASIKHYGLIVKIGLFVLVAGVIIYLLRSFSTPTEQQSDSPNTMTSEEIYAEVAQTFGFHESDLRYFWIYGQDKVVYATHTRGPGHYYVYKENGQWKLADDPIQSISNCSELITVPEPYRPPCLNTETQRYDYVTEQTDYMDLEKSSNYPLSQKLIYLSNE